MAETIEPTNELVSSDPGPELYVRVGLSKTASGWRHETTVSLRWHDVVYPGPDAEPSGLWVRRPDATGDAVVDEQAEAVLRDLLRLADDAARTEIAERERIDAGTEVR